jgi:dUTP pyrophosphatase
MCGVTTAKKLMWQSPSSFHQIEERRTLFSLLSFIFLSSRSFSFSPPFSAWFQKFKKFFLAFFTLMHIRRIAARNHQFIVYSSRISSIKRSNFINNYNKRRLLHDNIKMGSGGEGFTNEIEKKAKMMSAEDETLFENKLRVKKLSEHATVPVRGSDGAAGYDLSAAYDCVVKAKSKELVKTDLSIAIPKNTYARIAPRSGLAYKKFIDVLAGVVDYDYRGNVGVILANFGDEDFEVKKGDRIAQMILERITTPECVEVEDLEATERGAGGFGSTGVSK